MEKPETLKFGLNLVAWSLHDWLENDFAHTLLLFSEVWLCAAFSAAAAHYRNISNDFNFDRRRR